ncbi:ATP-binding protein [Salinivirga cyanobacteriivorans]|uniref:Serine-protein kinase RsbW n=1 Tax=Salinivirga cyanobacteriivorans TaxID=1307839 RepID=A0A0S2I088_9BACT|nr:ATP-binding protein [Salinivirga cyanobacteriivorans]ALO15697.1 Serine-protein kinase RsbW [Salinivirga cyanobacteriivorans]
MNKTISFSSDIKNISVVEQLIDDINRRFNLDKDIYGNILIAVLEAVTNSVIHGNKRNPDKKVNLAFDATDKNFQFIIEDEGPGFDFDNVPDPTKPINVEKPHGRGIFLMMRLSDDISFENNGRRVILKFFRK